MFDWFKKKKQEFNHEYLNMDYNLEPVYEIDGFKFYAYTDAKKIPTSRFETALIYTRFSQLCLTPERLQEYAKELRKANKKGDTGKVEMLCDLLLSSEKSFGERESLLNLAKVFTVLEGEDASKYVTSWQKKKDEIFEEYPECADFFLLWAYERSPNYMRQQANSIHQQIQVLEALKKVYRSMDSNT